MQITSVWIPTEHLNSGPAKEILSRYESYELVQIFAEENALREWLETAMPRDRYSYVGTDRNTKLSGYRFFFRKSS